MKKKIFALITAVALVAILCLSLVACNNDDELSPVKFSDKMSKDEIVETIGEIKNFTMEVHVTTEVDEENPDWGYAYAEYYCGENYFCMTHGYTNKMTTYYWTIVDGTRYYDIYKYVDEDGTAEEGAYVTDFKGYDTVDLGEDDIRDEEKALLEDIAEFVKNGSYTIENGNIKVAENDEYSMYYVLRDCNTTKMPAVPEKCKDYKNMEATVDVIKYRLSNDEEYYILEDISWFIVSYEVPETYNGKPVKEISDNLSSSNLKTLTISTNIVKVDSYCSHDAEDGELHIIYKGTKAQWEQVENHSSWDNRDGVRVTCSDGDYTTTQE